MNEPSHSFLTLGSHELRPPPVPPCEPRPIHGHAPDPAAPPSASATEEEASGPPFSAQIKRPAPAAAARATRNRRVGQCSVAHGGVAYTLLPGMRWRSKVGESCVKIWPRRVASREPQASAGA